MEEQERVALMIAIARYRAAWCLRPIAVDGWEAQIAWALRIGAGPEHFDAARPVAGRDDVRRYSFEAPELERGRRDARS